MAVTSALVLYAVLWFLTFLVVIPIRLKTQGDVGEIVPGTHAGAPHEHQLKKKAWITTGVAAVLWASPACGGGVEADPASQEGGGAGAATSGAVVGSDGRAASAARCRWAAATSVP